MKPLVFHSNSSNYWAAAQVTVHFPRKQPPEVDVEPAALGIRHVLTASLARSSCLFGKI